MKISPNILYNTNEVANFLKISPITVKRYVANNKIKSTKINGLRRFEGGDVLKIAKIKEPEKYRAGLKTIDLFAGIGGIRLGFEKVGFETVFANDFEPNCKKTYDINFSEVPLTVRDIKKIKADELPPFNFLLAGFPCQAFSVAGYREGFKDKKGRGNLFFELARIIESRKPIGFLLENVKNLETHDNKKTFKVIWETLDKLGYDVKYEVLSSAEYGNLPQNRERIYIVGFLKETKFINNFNFPSSIELKKNIDAILEKETVNQKYYYNDKPLYKRIRNYPFEKNTAYQWRRKYIRENKSQLFPTLTANMGMGGHNVPIIKDKNGIRKITPRECARIQGFPNSYKLPKIADSHLYKQFGNSVSVSVIERIAKNMKLATENKKIKLNQLTLLS